MEDNLKRALLHFLATLKWRPHCFLSAQCPQPCLTCGSRGGCSYVSPQGQAQMSWTSLQPCPLSRPAQCGACQASAFRAFCFRGRQFSGTGVSGQLSKTWRNRRAAKWVSEARSWIVYLSSFLRFFKDDPFAEPAEIVRADSSGVRRHCAAALSLGASGSGRSSSPAQGSAGGYRGWRLELEGALSPWGRLEVPRPEALTWAVHLPLRLPAPAPPLPVQPLHKPFAAASLPGAATQRVAWAPIGQM